MRLDRLIAFFTALKLTVVCLALAMVLVFIGTLAQVDMGLYRVQSEFFRSFFVFWRPQGAGWKIPVFPGGYLIGGVLLVNLVATRADPRRWAGKRTSIVVGVLGLVALGIARLWLHSHELAICGASFVLVGLLRVEPIHGGLILLLLGQLGTDMLSVESHLRLGEGQTKDYSESGRRTELAAVDTTEPNTDRVVAIPDSLLARRKIISHADLPFTIHVKRFLHNASLSNRPEASFEKSPATQDVGSPVWFREEPKVTKMDVRDVPTAIIELQTPQGSLGTWLVSELIRQPQSVTFNDRTWQLGLRLRRYYKPFSLQLLKFSFDKYPGSDIPKNFSSRVRVMRADTGEDREVLIKMNNPLRYGGETFYQSGYDENDPRVTILQVVRNPGWLTPYVACALVSVGLVIRFMSHLIEFLSRRRTA